MFQNSSNIVITGGTFTSCVSTIQPTGQKGMEILQQNIAPGAFHNSNESCDPPKCHPRTREAILSKIMEWVRTPCSERRAFFMWLYGPAGSGKSAIAHTIAEMCHEAGLLAASFFFSARATGRSDQSRFVATLAYQLALSIPPMRERLCMALETDPMLLTRSLEAQLLALVVLPFKSGYQEGTIRVGDIPLLIIVDGLDECKDARSQTDVLNALSTVFKRYSLPLYILISSRPEYHIRRTFDEDNFSTITTRTVLGKDYRSNNDSDISRFFEDKFTEIKRQHPAGAHIPPYWPNTIDEKNMMQLVQKASGQFIYASTIVKYVGSHRHWPPERLDIVLGVPSGEDDSSPFGELDAFYHHVLTAANISENKKISNVMMLLVLRPFQLRMTNKVIELFWGYRSGEVDMLLSDLHSIVDPQDHTSLTSEPRISHASLLDFLLDQKRSGKFHINKGDAYAKIAMQILQHLRPSQPGSLLRLNDGMEESLVDAFITTCTQANVTPELLEELYSMDASVLFTKYNYNHYNKTPELMCWFSKHHHPSYKTNLMDHHKPTFYSWLRRRLNDLPDGMVARCILASISLPQFIPLVSSRVYSILEDELPGPQDQDSSPEFFRRMRYIREYVNYSCYSSLEKFPEYCAMYSQFFTDSSVAGRLFINKTDYLTLAMKVWEFIRRRKYLEHDNVAVWRQNNAAIPSHDDWSFVPGHNWAIMIRNPSKEDYYPFGKISMNLFSALLANCLHESDAPTLISLLKDAPPKPWGSEKDPLYAEKLKFGEAITDYLEKMNYCGPS